MLQHENLVWNRGITRLAGMDEAGRGPLAGPVTAAAVIIPQALLETEASAALRGLTDSKQLAPRQRRHFYDWLYSAKGVVIGVGAADPAEIDAINILQATQLAMCRALAALPEQPEHVLVDGLPVAGLPCPSTAIVRGDGASLLIAAASVVAKVNRDNHMDALHLRHPQYGFNQHKGYGTARHIQAMLKHGCIKQHRRSFRPVREIEEIRSRWEQHECAINNKTPAPLLELDWRRKP